MDFLGYSIGRQAERARRGGLAAAKLREEANGRAGARVAVNSRTFSTWPLSPLQRFVGIPAPLPTWQCRDTHTLHFKALFHFPLYQIRRQDYDTRVRRSGESCAFLSPRADVAPGLLIPASLLCAHAWVRTRLHARMAMSGVDFISIFDTKSQRVKGVAFHPTRPWFVPNHRASPKSSWLFCFEAKRAWRERPDWSPAVVLSFMRPALPFSRAIFHLLRLGDFG